MSLTIDALASYRLTRLIVSDGIVDRPRTALLEALQRRGRRKLVELVECPWCIGVWVAGSVVAARRIVPGPWAPLAETLAFSAIAGLLATEVRSKDDTHDVVTIAESTASTPRDHARRQAAPRG